MSLGPYSVLLIPCQDDHVNRKLQGQRAVEVVPLVLFYLHSIEPPALYVPDRGNLTIKS
jgi:hypothetical protein